MPRGTSKPYPWDVILNGKGYMVGRDQNGNLLYKRRAPQQSDADPPATRPRFHRNFQGGVGIKRRRGEEHDDALNTTSTTSEPGGVDGSFGPLILSPLVTSVTVDSGKTIRDIVPFGGAAYAAVNTKVYKSANGLFSDASSVYTAQSNITDLEVFQGTNGLFSLVLGQQHGPIVWSTDGTTWVVDGNTTGRALAPKGFFKTVNAGVAFTSYTDNVADANTATVADLSSLDTLANGDYVVLGAEFPFYSATFTIGSANSNASVVAGHIWDGTTWVAVTITDGTISAGHSLGLTGTMSWTRPATAWARTVIANTGQAVSLFYLRLSWSAALDASTTVQKISLLYNHEADRFAVSGNTLASLRGNRITLNTAGGPSGTWFSNSDPIGDDSQTAEGLGAAGGAIFAKLSRSFGANNNDGGAITYDSDAYKGGISSSGDQASCTFDNAFYYAHDNSFRKFSPLTGPDQVGPERLFGLEDVADRFTAACGDREHFLWAAGYGSDGKARIWKYGSFREAINAESGEPEYQRFDGWHLVLHLGTTKITSMASYYISTQPYLVTGDTAGVVRYWVLPKGVSPLEANSGATYCATGAGVLPSDYGDDETRQIVSEQASILGRNLASGISVALATKAPTGSSWTTQFTATSAGDQAFASVYSGLGVDVRLTLATNDSSKTPILDAYALNYQGVSRSTRYEYSFSVVAGEVWSYSKRSPLTPAGWQAQIDTAAALASCSITDIDGNADTISVKAVEQTAMARDWRRGQARVLSITAASLS